MVMQCSYFKFELIAEDGPARKGRLMTPHGEVKTPAFMPVGTQATVKGMTPELLKSIGTQIVLSNTYHLHIRPGEKLISSLGGLHRFMSWDGPILTDSGGFQVFSLARLMEVSDSGIKFASHIDGTRHELTPEKAIVIQEDLGSDIMMCLDECIPYPADIEYARQAADRTTAWARRSLDARTKDRALFGIIQGGVYPELRKKNAREISSMPFEGMAIGGLSVGEDRDVMLSTLDATLAYIPVEKPRYLMGVGGPVDIVEAVARGVDMFDCVLPTRNARNGMLFTRQGRLSIKQARFRDDPLPPDENCSCYTCRNFSRAYLRHLFLSKEILSSILNTIHNLHFYLELMSDIRHAIENKCLDDFRKRVKEIHDGDISLRSW